MHLARYTHSLQIRSDGRTDPDTHLPLLLARLHFLDREGIRRGGVGGQEASTATPPPEAEEDCDAEADPAVAGVCFVGSGGGRFRFPCFLSGRFRHLHYVLTRGH